MKDGFDTQFSHVSVKGDLISTINSFLKDLLLKTEIEGIIIPHELPNSTNLIPALIVDTTELASANPLAPIMPVNASKAVQDFTRLQATQKKVAVVLRPCEIRATFELIKLNQASLENIIIIGVDCPGTFSIQSYNQKETQVKGKNDLNTASLIGSFKNLKDHSELRSACVACEYFDPVNSDIIIGSYGLDPDKELLIGINSEAANRIIEPLALKFDENANNKQQERMKAINNLKEIRLKFIEELINSTQTRIHGLDNFLNELSNCINCHNCMTVCPICYCKECFFESPTFDLESEKYIKMAEYKGAIRLPSNMVLFHVTRFNHMVLSCVACGMCEQGCPVDIPLLSIYKTVGLNAQKVFNYEPGLKLNDEIPILTFQEDELEPR